MIHEKKTVPDSFVVKVVSVMAILFAKESTVEILQKDLDQMKAYLEKP